MGEKIYDYEEFIQKSNDIVGLTMRDICVDKIYFKNENKGALGQLVETMYFGKPLDSKSDSDFKFKNRKIELKVTPIRKICNGKWSSKERLVLGMINYQNEYKKQFENSHVITKCQNMMIMYYEYKKDTSILDFKFLKSELFEFSKKDLLVIKKDWEIIVKKIIDGEAHLLSESDTCYLGACTKGKNANDVAKQDFSDIMAMKRAFCLKNSFMTAHVRNIFNETDTSIIKEYELIEKTIEEVLKDRCNKYIGMDRDNLKDIFEIDSKSKQVNGMILRHMIGIKNSSSNVEEIEKANIQIRSLTIKKGGSAQEDIKIHKIKKEDFKNIIWEDSKIYDIVNSKIYFIGLFQKIEGIVIFKGIKIFRFGVKHLQEIEQVWEDTKLKYNETLEVWNEKGKNHNNLIKSSDDLFAHIRPSAQDGKDTEEVNGQQLCKQGFWLNSNTILNS